MKVPQGRQKIAHGFSRGLAVAERHKPRQGRQNRSTRFLPPLPGLVPHPPHDPRLKPWAILCRLSETWPADKTRHDKLVLLVNRRHALTPRLRAAGADAEKATLQNAVTATDRQIDALVYDLYALTPEEIQLVEGGQ